MQVKLEESMSRAKQDIVLKVLEKQKTISPTV